MQIVAILIKAGATIDIKDPLGNTPLFYAADRDQVDIVKLLLDAGAAVDAENRSGVTPLMIAAERGNAEVVRHAARQGRQPEQDRLHRPRRGRAGPRKATGRRLVQMLRQAACEQAPSR